VIDATFIWDLDDDPDGNVQHLAEHGVTVDDRAARKHSSGLRRASSSQSSGRKLPTILG
jgi:hypothetical protein